MTVLCNKLNLLPGPKNKQSMLCAALIVHDTFGIYYFQYSIDGISSIYGIFATIKIIHRNEQIN